MTPSDKEMAHSGELVERLENASVGSRELDGAVARLFGWHRVEPRFSRNKHGGWIAPEDFIGLYSDGSPKLDSLHGTDIHRDPPRLTQSLDAALALAERVGRDPAGILMAALFFASQTIEKPRASDFARFACIAILKATTAASQAPGGYERSECTKKEHDNEG